MLSWQIFAIPLFAARAGFRDGLKQYFPRVLLVAFLSRNVEEGCRSSFLFSQGTNVATGFEVRSGWMRGRGPAWDD